MQVFGVGHPTKNTALHLHRMDCGVVMLTSVAPTLSFKSRHQYPMSFASRMMGGCSWLV